MRLDQLVEEAAKARGWYVSGCGSIRNERYPNGASCVLAVVAKRKTRKRFDDDDFEEAGKALGIRRDAVSTVVSAADDGSRYADASARRLRRKMLKAFKLRDRD